MNTMVVDRETGQLLDEHNDSCWGYIGRLYAEEELDSNMLSLAIRFGSPLN